MSPEVGKSCPWECSPCHNCGLARGQVGINTLTSLLPVETPGDVFHRLEPKARNKADRGGRNRPQSLTSCVEKVGMRQKENNPSWIYHCTHLTDEEAKVDGARGPDHTGLSVLKRWSFDSQP